MSFTATNPAASLDDGDATDLGDAVDDEGVAGSTGGGDGDTAGDAGGVVEASAGSRAVALPVANATSWSAEAFLVDTTGSLG